MCREFEKNGGTIIRNCKVDKILVENGTTTGVDTSEGTFYAPVVVSSSGIQPTILKLVGEEHFDKTYFVAFLFLWPLSPKYKASTSSQY